MYNTVKTMKCFNKKYELQQSLQIFQKGILMSITSLKLLRSKMNEKFGFKYILTHRLNQDCLENFFSQIRGRTGSSDHPTPVECLERIKAIMLGKNPGVALHNHTNTVELDPEEYVSATFMNALSGDNCTTNETKTETSTSDSNDWPVEYLEVMSMDASEKDANLDDSFEWPVEFLEDLPMEIDQEPDLNISYVSDIRSVEVVEEYSNNGIVDSCTELIEDPLSENCDIAAGFQINDEFIQDLETEMEADEISRRIEKSREDGIGKILLKLFTILINVMSFKFDFRYRVHFWMAGLQT